jgi:hypothetical protein
MSLMLATLVVYCSVVSYSPFFLNLLVYRFGDRFDAVASKISRQAPSLFVKTLSDGREAAYVAGSAPRPLSQRLF